MDGGDGHGHNQRCGTERRPIRVWADGCFDMMHIGHANALRQAKNYGDYLIVGVHTDEEIRRHKGPPVMNEQERYAAVRACKWVDEVVEGAPYVTDMEVVDKYSCEFVVHGDDITTDEFGNDTYQAIKDAGRYREFYRTPGVSTTNLVGRMLSLNRNRAETGEVLITAPTSQPQPISSYTGSDFLPTSNRIVQFSSGNEPRPGNKIVYISGAFDLFHVGHIAAMQEARKLGDYLIVGVHTDDEVEFYRGRGHPICSLHERTLGVLQCRYADEVVIGAPYTVNEEMMQRFKMDVVVHGGTDIILDRNGCNPYQECIDRGIFNRIVVDSQVTTEFLICRVLKNCIEFEERNKRKNLKELKVQEYHDRQKKSKADAPSVAAVEVA